MLYILNTTSKCNLECVYCYEKNRRTRLRAKSFDLNGIKKVYSAILKYQQQINDTNIAFQWHGGEATLVSINSLKQFLDLQKPIFQKKYKIRNQLQTNLVNLSDDLIDLIKDYKLDVGTSYDCTPKTRLLKNGKDASPRILKNMHLLRELNIPFGVVCVVTKYNVKDLKNIYKFFLDNRISLRFVPATSSSRLSQFNNFSAHEYAKNLFLTIKEYFANHLFSEDGPAFHFHNAYTYASLLAEGFSFSPDCNYTDNCWNNFANIRQNGDVYPCARCAEDNFYLGNCFTQPLIDILSRSHPVRKLQNDRREHPLPGPCRRCTLQGICNRGNPCESINEHDFFKTSKFACKLNKYILPRVVRLLHSYQVETRLDKNKLVYLLD